MLHFSCDLCGQPLGQRRFVVKLEVYPAYDPEELGQEDLDADNLQEVSQILEQMEASGKIEIDDCNSKNFRFDLCLLCQQKFIQDPLGRDALQRMNFSEN